MLVSACEDVINLENNIEKELLYKILSPKDSLSVLQISGHDYGRVKIRSMNTAYIQIENVSDTVAVTLYSYDNTNKQGLFTYEFPNGFPIEINPGENTYISESIKVKFLADAFSTGPFYDTLYFNNDRNFYIPIEARIMF